MSSRIFSGYSRDNTIPRKGISNREGRKWKEIDQGYKNLRLFKIPVARRKRCPSELIPEVEETIGDAEAREFRLGEDSI